MFALPSEEFDPASFSGLLPIFPLENVVLFPRSVLPLHIFEPRYRAMVRDALERERLIGMALLKEGWEKDYEGCPEIFTISGMGRIIQQKRLDDGKYNILLRGLKRVKILEETQQHPYRIARVRILEDIPGPGDPAAEEKMRLRLLSLFSRFLDGEPEIKAKVWSSLESMTDLGIVSDFLAAFVKADIRAKQGLLEERQIVKRAGKLAELFEEAIRGVSAGEDLSKKASPQAPRRGFPPKPSWN